MYSLHLSIIYHISIIYLSVYLSIYLSMSISFSILLSGVSVA